MQALREEEPHNKAVDVVVMNHGFWMWPAYFWQRGDKQSDAHTDLKQIYEAILQEGLDFEQRKGVNTFLIWKSTTKSSSEQETDWQTVSHQAQVNTLYSHVCWQLCLKGSCPVCVNPSQQRICVLWQIIIYIMRVLIRAKVLLRWGKVARHTSKWRDSAPTLMVHT